MMKTIQTGSCFADHILPGTGKRRAKIDFLTLLLLVAVGMLLYLLLQGERSEPNSNPSVSVETFPAEDKTNHEWAFLDQVDIASQFKQGEWSLLLYHHQDPHCAETLARYQRLAERLKEMGKDSLQVALIEIPPYSKPSLNDGTMPLCIHGRLADNQEWTIHTPVEIRIREGIVKATSKKLPGLRSW